MGTQDRFAEEACPTHTAEATCGILLNLLNLQLSATTHHLVHLSTPSEHSAHFGSVQFVQSPLSGSANRPYSHCMHLLTSPVQGNGGARKVDA